MPEIFVEKKCSHPRFLRVPHYDVVVVGSGLSGICSAIFAARKGKKVMLVTRGSGVLAIGGGTIDVLGYDATGKWLASPFSGMDSLDVRHPYQLTGEETVRRSIDAFLDLCREEAYPYICDAHRNSPVVTALGTLKPSYLVPPALSLNTVLDAREIHVVSVEGLKDFSPVLMTKGLAKLPVFADKRLVASQVPCPFHMERDLSALDLARFLDKPDGVNWLAECIRKRVPHSSTCAVFLPPIIGTLAGDAAHVALEARTGLRIRETVGLPPAVTGLRLHSMLLRVLRRHGIDVASGITVTSADVEKGRCRSVVFASEGKERRYAADAFIFATGGFLGEGFQTTPTRAWEPILNLDLPLNPSSPGWSQTELYPSSGSDKSKQHGFATLGPSVDTALRPLGADGKPLCDNVYFVGKTLGGYDHATEKSGNGVALATAFHAAQQL